MVRGNKFKPAPAAPSFTLPVAESYTAGALLSDAEPRHEGHAVRQPEPGSGSLLPPGQAGRSCNNDAVGRSAGSARPRRPGPAKALGHPWPAGSGECSAKRHQTEAIGAILAGDASGASLNILAFRAAAEEHCPKRRKVSSGVVDVAGADAGRGEAAAAAFSARAPSRKQHKGWTAGAVCTGAAIAGPPKEQRHLDGQCVPVRSALGGVAPLKGQRHAEGEGVPRRLETAAVAVHTTVQAPGVHGTPCALFP